jgi:hypothetical protein
MYKIVTHHITEEHFDHPEAVNLKLAHDHNQKMGDFYIYGYTGPLSRLEKSSLGAWMRLVGRLRAILISLGNKTTDTQALLTQLGADVTDLGNVMRPYFADADITKFQTLLTTVATDLIAVIKDIQASTDTTADQATLTTDVGALTDFLAAASPLWDKDAVTKILTSLAAYLQTQARARLVQDWASDLSAANAYYDVVSAQGHQAEPGLADVFTAGVINQAMQ